MRIYTESGHVTDDSLALHILSDLPPNQAVRVVAHLRECAICRKREVETTDFIGLFKSLAQAQTGRHGFNCSVGAIRLRGLSHRHPA